MKRAVSAIYLFLLVWSALALVGAEIKPEWADIVIPPLWSVIIVSPFVLVGAVSGVVEPREALVWASAIVIISFVCALLAGVLMGLEEDRRPDPWSLALAAIHLCVAGGGATAWMRSRPSSRGGHVRGR